MIGQTVLCHLWIKGCRVKDGLVEALGVDEVMEETHSDPKTQPVYALVDEDKARDMYDFQEAPELQLHDLDVLMRW